MPLEVHRPCPIPLKPSRSCWIRLAGVFEEDPVGRAQRPGGRWCGGRALRACAASPGRESPWTSTARLSRRSIVGLIAIFAVSTISRRVAWPSCPLARSPPARAAILPGPRRCRGDRCTGGAARTAPWLAGLPSDRVDPALLAAALVLGILAYPRGRELEGLARPMDLHGKLEQ